MKTLVGLMAIVLGFGVLVGAAVWAGVLAERNPHHVVAPSSFDSTVKIYGK